MLRRIVAFGSLLFAAQVAAEPAELSGEAIKQLVAGAVVEIDTPLGVKVPLRYTEEGRLTGEARSLAYILGAPTDIGRWWVASDRLCQRWTRWFDGAIHCLRISQDGSRIFWRRDDGESGSATITTSPVNIARAPNRTEEPSGRAAPRTDQPAPAESSAAAMLATIPFVVIPPAQAAIAGPPAGVPQPSSRGNSARVPGEAAKASVAITSTKAAPHPAQVIGPTQAAPASRALATNEPKGPRRQEAFRVVGVAIDDVLNVREGPSADHVVVGTILPEATGVRLVGTCLSTWCPISHRGVAGWVNRMYLVRDTPSRAPQRDP